MFDMCRVLIVSLAIYFVYVGGDDPDGREQNYSTVFKDMPALFERVMEMLHEKPEVLERNDVITFHDNVAKQASHLSPDEVELHKREANFYDFGNGPQYDVLLRAKDDFGAFIGPVGSGGAQLITADEMAEMMLMVERELETYNKDN